MKSLPPYFDLIVITNKESYPWEIGEFWKKCSPNFIVYKFEVEFQNVIYAQL